MMDMFKGPDGKKISAYRVNMTIGVILLASCRIFATIKTGTFDPNESEAWIWSMLFLGKMAQQRGEK